MSLLKKMANNVSSKRGIFTNSYPVIVNSLNLDNDALERIIRNEEDPNGHRTRAKCFRTRWDLHTEPLVNEVGQKSISIAHENPLAGRTSTDGTPEEIEYGIRECWGLIYQKGEETKSHSHWPSSWAFVYNVRACPACSPLVIPSNGIHPDTILHPIEGQVSLFPAWLNHEVPPQLCNHDRIIIAGNLDIIWRTLWDKETNTTNCWENKTGYLID